jgi:hypothetical protein
MHYYNLWILMYLFHLLITPCLSAILSLKFVEKIHHSELTVPKLKLRDKQKTESHIKRVSLLQCVSYTECFLFKGNTKYFSPVTSD